MKIAFHNFGDDTINAYVGGEGRWAVNWIHFLRTLGHDVQVIGISQAADFDLCFSLDTCGHIVDKPHIHNHFSPRNAGILNFPCYKKHGTMLVSNPYRASYEDALPWAEENNITQLFLPMCYPDDLLPGDRQPGFQRTEITWATKDPFNFLFCPSNSPRHHIPQCAINTLKGMVRLSERTDFKMNLVLDGFLNSPEANAFGVQEVIAKIPNVEKKGRVTWTELVQIMARSKLNVPVGGLSGSCLESIFSEALPMFHSDISFFKTTQDITLLPPPQQTTEQDIYEALETFWCDKRAYTRAWEHYQDAFVDHRTEGLTRHFNTALEKIGLS